MQAVSSEEKDVYPSNQMFYIKRFAAAAGLKHIAAVRPTNC